jgi:hypothetical protein
MWFNPGYCLASLRDGPPSPSARAIIWRAFSPILATCTTRVSHIALSAETYPAVERPLELHLIGASVEIAHLNLNLLLLRHMAVNSQARVRRKFLKRLEFRRFGGR